MIFCKHPFLLMTNGQSPLELIEYVVLRRTGYGHSPRCPQNNSDSDVSLDSDSVQIGQPHHIQIQIRIRYRTNTNWLHSQPDPEINPISMRMRDQCRPLHTCTAAKKKRKWRNRSNKSEPSFIDKCRLEDRD